MTAVLAIYAASLAYIAYEILNSTPEKTMTLRHIADATIASLEDSATEMHNATDAETLDAINELGANNAILGYMLIRQALIRGMDGFDTPCPTVGSTKVRIAD